MQADRQMKLLLLLQWSANIPKYHTHTHIASLSSALSTSATFAVMVNHHNNLELPFHAFCLSPSDPLTESLRVGINGVSELLQMRHLSIELVDDLQFR